MFKLCVAVLVILLAYPNESKRFHGSFGESSECTNDIDRDVIIELKSQWRKWQELQQSLCYDMTVKRTCFCPECYIQYVDLGVEDNEITSIVFTDPTLSEPGGVCENFELTTDQYKTMNQLFRYTYRSIVNGISSITITYHPTEAYITSVYIDFSSCIADEEFSMEVSSLTYRDTCCINSVLDADKYLIKIIKKKLLWKKSKIRYGSCYKYNFQRSSFCPGCCQNEQFTVTVENNQVTLVEFTGEISESCQDFEINTSDFWTIDNIFNYVIDQLDQGIYSLQIDYNNMYDYPSYIYIDLYNPQCVADAGLGYTITDLEFITCS